MQAFLFRVWFVCCCFFFDYYFVLLFFISSHLIHSFVSFIFIHIHPSIHPFIHIHSFFIFLLASYKEMACTFDDSFIFKFNSPISQVGLKKLINNHLHFLLHTHTYTLIVPVPVCLLIILMWETGCACVRAYFFLSTFISPSSFWWTATNMYQLLLFSYTYVYCMW